MPKTDNQKFVKIRPGTEVRIVHLPGEEVRQAYPKEKLDEINPKNVRLPWEQVRIVNDSCPGTEKIHIVRPSTFREKIYKIVRKIPKGETLTYKQVAVLAGRPRAYRAVGNILNKNYDPNIPCHRVIRSDKKIGGYNRGEALKQTRLKDEGFDFLTLKHHT